MKNEYEIKIHNAVNRFKSWAKENFPWRNEENDNGDWGFICDEFDDMCGQIVNVIVETSVDEATEQMIDDMLYGIARDNECSYIIENLLEYPEWYSFLCRRCLETGYTNAKWQFAESLREYKGSDHLQEMIYDYLDTGDELTERLALQSLAYIDPKRAEEYAVRFWERNKYEGEENRVQKQKALHVLFVIRSDKLPYYLDLAEKSNHKYLKAEAERIRKELEKENGEAGGKDRSEDERA